MRKNNCNPKLEMEFWIRRAEWYFADKDKLLFSILNSGLNDKQIQARMGEGYSLIAELFSGKGIGIYSALHVEQGIRTEKDLSKTGSIPYGPPGVHASLNSDIDLEISKLFSYVKYDVGKRIRELSFTQRRDGDKGIELQALFTALEDLHKESLLASKDREMVKVRKLWKFVIEYNKKYDVFSKYRGNSTLKEKVLRFINDR